MDPRRENGVRDNTVVVSFSFGSLIYPPLVRNQEKTWLAGVSRALSEDRPFLLLVGLAKALTRHSKEFKIYGAGYAMWMRAARILEEIFNARNPTPVVSAR